MLEPITWGHPESVLKWTCLSTRTLAHALKKTGHVVSQVGKLLKGTGFTLPSNSKRTEGDDHPDRNEQFLYINNKTARYLACGFHAISVDKKKKELIGNYQNPGKAYRPMKQPGKVNVPDFGPKQQPLMVSTTLEAMKDL